MKNLKTFTSLFVALMVTSLLCAQGAEKTLVKSFNLKGDHAVLLDLDGNVDVQEWNGDLLRIQINLAVDNGSAAMLKSLIIAGRYNLKSKSEGGETTITAPGMNKDVKIRGKELLETISYTVFAPSDVSVRIADESSTNLEDGTASPSSM